MSVSSCQVRVRVHFPKMTKALQLEGAFATDVVQIWFVLPLVQWYVCRTLELVKSPFVRSKHCPAKRIDPLALYHNNMYRYRKLYLCR